MSAGGTHLLSLQEDRHTGKGKAREDSLKEGREISILRGKGKADFFSFERKIPVR